jgi:chromate transporter
MALDLFAIIVFVLAFLLLNSKRIKVGPILLLVVGALVGIGYALIRGMV